MKIGDYVRTKDYGISKIYMVYKQFILITTNYKQIMNEDIIKSSPNIIDLIEVGDYVNGYKIIDIVEAIYYDNKKTFILQDKIENFASSHQIKKYINDEQIKSIVTKEQFKSMEYKVGE